MGQAVFIYNYFVFGYSKYVHFEILVNEKKMALAPPVCQKKKKKVIVIYQFPEVVIQTILFGSQVSTT